MKLIRLNEVYKNYIWGGTKLNSVFNKKSEFDKTAESWELSVHPDGESVISTEENNGMLLSEYIKANPWVLGNGRKSDELPILIKLIDAEDNLSIQVHPNNEQAHEWENQNGKTEMWYVLDANKDAKIIYGVKENISKEDLKEAIINNTVEDLLNNVPSKPGDVFFVDAGTIHAIGKGNVIAEIQQNSNVTYRLYDYDRRDKDGNPRELHIDKGVKASVTNKMPKRQIPLSSDGARLLGCCEYFSVKEFAVEDKLVLNCNERSYQSIIGVEGTLCLTNEDNNEPVNVGNTVFLPAGFGEYTLNGTGKVLVVENPPRYSVLVNFGIANISTSVIDENGVIYGANKRKTNLLRKYTEILEDMVKLANESVAKSGLLWDDIENISIECPDADNAEIGGFDFYNIPVKEYLEQKLGKKTYIYNNIASKD